MRKKQIVRNAFYGASQLGWPAGAEPFLLATILLDLDTLDATRDGFSRQFLAEVCGATDARVDAALRALIAEGLAHRNAEHGRYTITRAGTDFAASIFIESGLVVVPEE